MAVGCEHGCSWSSPGAISTAGMQIKVLSLFNDCLRWLLTSSKWIC